MKHDILHTPVRGAVLLTLTTREQNPLVAQGHIRRFWAAVRQRWPGTDYFCWAELQARGAVHYHALWLNAPHLRKGLLPAWIEHTWGLGRTQARWRDRAWWKRSGTDYVLGYAKKMGAKSWQQDYDALPPELRTFMSERLAYSGPELDAHTDRAEVRFIPAGDSQLGNHEAVLLLIGHIRHVVRSACDLLSAKPGPMRQQHKTGPPRRDRRRPGRARAAAPGAHRAGPGR